MFRFYDILEEPVKGHDWYLKKLKCHLPVGKENYVWFVELGRKSSGETVSHTHEELVVAWHRTVEAAYASSNGIFQDAEGQSRS